MGVVGLITIVILFIVLLTRKTVPQNWLSAMSANMRSGQAQESVNGTKSGTEFIMPSMKELLYPGEIPTFEALKEDKHKDLRAVVYTFLSLDTERKKPFSEEELMYIDFGKKKEAYEILLKAGLVQQLELREEIELCLTKEQLVELAKEKHLSPRGKKDVIAERLVINGFKLDRRKYRKHLFRFTEEGIEKQTEYHLDKQNAVAHAIDALKRRNYKEAVGAYRAFDDKWGFVHTSGKKHTIFAYYEIPFEHFNFVENYSMHELNNSEEFKETLRACLFAGLMRGCQERWELRWDFEKVCGEKINCPRLLELFDYEEDVLQAMQRQVNHDTGMALEYYISHVLYLSRKAER